MSAAEAHAVVCEVEHRHELLRHRVDGWSVWPVLRVHVVRELFAIPFTATSGLTRAQRLRLAAADLPRLALVPKVENAILTYNSGLLEPDGGRYRDIWFDDIADLRTNTFRIERVNSARFLDRRRKAAVPADITSAMLDQWNSLRGRTRPPADLLAAASAISDVLRRELRVAVATPQWVEFWLRNFHWGKRVFRWLLSRLAAKKVVVADSGEYALVAAARELGMKTFELQHGINDRHHPGYVWQREAVPYKAFMPIPERMLIYGEHWRGEMDASGFWGDDIRVVGSPRLDRYRRQGKRERRDDKFRVVVAAQGFHAEKVAQFVLEAVRSSSDVEVIVKLHPVYGSDRAAYESVLGGEPRAIVMAADEGPSTFALLADADLHVSISSASHYDAIGIGVPTVILGLPMSEVVEPLRMSGHALYAATPAELADIVRRRGELHVPDDVREYYFRSGAEQNISRELNAEAKS